MTIYCLQPYRAAASPAVSAAPAYARLDESNMFVAALLRFSPYKLSDQTVRRELLELLWQIDSEAAGVPAWGSEDEATPAETYVYAARAFVRAAGKNRTKLRFNLELAHTLYREQNALDRWGEFEEFALHAYTDTDGHTRVAVYLAGLEKAEPIADLPASLKRDQVEDLLTCCYSGYVRGRRDGQAELRARAGAILSVVE